VTAYYVWPGPTNNGKNKNKKWSMRGLDPHRKQTKK